jgi:glutamate synthase (NADPH) large chain
MQNWKTKYEQGRQHLIQAGAYNPADEHDACGVGLVASIDGKPRREIVELAIKSLKNVWHRGAVDADGKTGDGAGIMLDIPQEFFKHQVARTGHKAKNSLVAVGMIFLPRTDFAAQDEARTIVESELLKTSCYIYGWRQVPIDVSIIGDKAAATRPAIEQVMFRPPKSWDAPKLERELYIVRRRIEKRALKAALPGFYICSLSGRVITYKGMFLAEQIDTFYPDLKDELFTSRAALFHQRYSTNTFPEWWLAHPYRMIAHNGEINTVRANTNFMKNHEIKMASSAFGRRAEDVKPVIQKGSSDSAALDAVFELLVRAGRTAPLAKTLLIPEAYSKRTELMPDNWRAFYEYCNAVMEPWDGPAALVGYDGEWVMAGLDRNGLRPLRYAISNDGILAVGSETGICPLDENSIITKGAIKPGRLIAVDLSAGKFFDSDQIINELSSAKPYDKWLQQVEELDGKLSGEEPKPSLSGEALMRAELACGRSREEVDVVLKPMAEQGKESIGSMGDDTPLAVLSDEYRPLSHFFRQKFSQVTNPPIDPLRETRVMGLKTRFRNLRNILADEPAQFSGQTEETAKEVAKEVAQKIAQEVAEEMYVLESPVLTNAMYDKYRDIIGDNVAVLNCTFAPPKPGARHGSALKAVLKHINKQAEKAVRAGIENIVLSDEALGAGNVAAPIILCVGGVHAHLVKLGLRADCSLIVRSAECLDTHYFAVLIGAGATVVNPYMTQNVLSELANNGRINVDTDTAIANYKTAIDNGLLKIISKAGISVISSYRGGNNFEAIGLSRSLVDEHFPGMTSRISGIGLSGLEQKTIAQHRLAYASEKPYLPIGGFYRKRAGSERHAYGADMINLLQTAVRTDDFQTYKKFSKMVDAQAPIQIRDLLGFNPLGKSVPIERVENINEIRRRFLTQAMSLGALSPEAHGTLNIAMNRIGARSVSGEGGEDPKRYKPLPNGDNANSEIKQIASGRFGVTAEYLNNCSEVEIKVAQGAKPGEGGQLPGFKVTDMIAKLRHATPGVTLISPPPHHDIYSIEDLAQLIYDLKQINPRARVCVKLVASSGVGTIAAGVAKAKADTILIAGHNGGTGASPNTSLKYAGAPWELGLSEVHQILSLNGLRDKITLRTDGGLKTGRDIVIAAMLGAEEFGVGTLSLVAMGCLMVRQCHSNTCPVGVCTQDENLRGKFAGKPEHVINLMTFIAEEVREILASLGVTSLSEIIGRADMLSQVSRGATHLDDLDLNAVLTRIDIRPVKDTRMGRTEVPDSLDVQILEDGQQLFEHGKKTELVYTVRNTNRAVGTRSSSEIYQNFGVGGLPDGQLTIRLRGSAGQSLGAFGMKGLRLIVDGDANDYVGKGLSGAEIFLAPQGDSKIDAHASTILGNTCLYGATSGTLLASGRAGERFAVRNSGANAVVEGCGNNGLEYMTGGTVVILGAIGDNFGAGMTGGMAFVYDPDGNFEKAVNPDSVVWQNFESAHWEQACKFLIAHHKDNTGSEFAKAIIRDWDIERTNFVQVVPKEMLERLAHPLRDAA